MESVPLGYREGLWNFGYELKAFYHVRPEGSLCIIQGGGGRLAGLHKCSVARRAHLQDIIVLGNLATTPKTTPPATSKNPCLEFRV